MCYHVLPYDVLSQSRKAQDPDILVRKFGLEVVCNVSKNFTTLAEGVKGEETEVSNQKTKTSVSSARYTGKKQKQKHPPTHTHKTRIRPASSVWRSTWIPGKESLGLSKCRLPAPQPPTPTQASMLSAVSQFCAPPLSLLSRQQAVMLPSLLRCGK